MNPQLNTLLDSLMSEFFIAANIQTATKRQIFQTISDGIKTQENELRELVVEEVKLTPVDAQKEVDRARKTFELAALHAHYIKESSIVLSDKILYEKRVARGPLLAITPFSSPLSSPAHKIAMGLLAGTTVLFKPSPLAQRCGCALFNIISKACSGKYIYFSTENNLKQLRAMVADDRIGVVSFTGGYKTGKQIIKNGGIKKYQMELTGGNAPVVFAPDFALYDNKLLDKLVDGIAAKNGQRCVSIKHIFIPREHEDFIRKLQERLLTLKKKTKFSLQNNECLDLGPLISANYARKSVKSVQTIIQAADQIDPWIGVERKRAYVFPTMYVIPAVTATFIKHALSHDLPGPIVFVHFYAKPSHYKEILATLQNDYINSGLQLSVYVKNKSATTAVVKNLLWGGIIFNDIPTFRNDIMSFGGFGKSGLGKEGFFESINAYTDPQTIVYPRDLI